MDERKRFCDGNDDSVAGQTIKRTRPIVEDFKLRVDDSNKIVTRLLMNRTQFAKVIGKGGETIAQLRTSSGSNMKGGNIDQEQRILLISGTLKEVIFGFELVLQVLSRHSGGTMSSNSNPSSASSIASTISSMKLSEFHDIFSITLLVDHNKTGKIIGNKGAHLQLLKEKSGVGTIRIDKEPLELYGAVLRKVTIEGSNAAISRLHSILYEIILDVSLDSNAVSGTVNSGMSVTSSTGSVYYDSSSFDFPSKFPWTFSPANAPQILVNASQHQSFAQYPFSSPSAVYRNSPQIYRQVTGDPMAMTTFAQSLPLSYQYVSEYEAAVNPSDGNGVEAPLTHPSSQEENANATEAIGSLAAALPQATTESESTHNRNVEKASELQSNSIASPEGTVGRNSGDVTTASVVHQNSSSEAVGSSQTNPSGENLELDYRSTVYIPVDQAHLRSIGLTDKIFNQIMELQQVLITNYNLELKICSRCVTEKATEKGNQSAFGMMPITAESIVTERSERAKKQGLYELYLAVPAICVGAIIGKSGKVLRELQLEFGVRIFVEREEYFGKRIVALTYIVDPTNQMNKKDIDGQENEGIHRNSMPVEHDTNNVHCVEKKAEDVTSEKKIEEVTDILSHPQTAIGDKDLDALKDSAEASSSSTGSKRIRIAVPNTIEKETDIEDDTTNLANNCERSPLNDRAMKIRRTAGEEDCDHLSAEEAKCQSAIAEKSLDGDGANDLETQTLNEERSPDTVKYPPDYLIHSSMDGDIASCNPGNLKRKRESTASEPTLSNQQLENSSMVDEFHYDSAPLDTTTTIRNYSSDYNNPVIEVDHWNVLSRCKERIEAIVEDALQRRNNSEKKIVII